MTHIEVVTPAIFEAIESGEVTCEIRRARGPIVEGDRLIYQERRDKGQQSLTGKEITTEITYVQKKNAGLRTGFVLIMFKKSKDSLFLNTVNITLPTLEDIEADKTQ